MSAAWEPEDLEPERYELHEPAVWIFELQRREFLAAFGGGLAVLLFAEPGELLVQDRGRRGQRGNEGPAELAAWLQIDEKGAVTVFTGKVEVGQGSRTSLSQVVAEELRLPVTSIELVMADTDRVPYDSGTAGSRTTPAMAPQLRRVAATAREILIETAAAAWQTVSDGITLADGKVQHAASGRSLGFGELTKGRKLVETIRRDVRLTPAADCKVVGKPASKVKAGDIVTGRHRYPSDLTRPGMLHAKVLRPPRFGAKLVSASTEAARALEGVTVVHDGDFVGAAAPSEARAAQAIAAIEARWDGGGGPASQDLVATLRTGGPAEPAGKAEIATPDGGVENAGRYTVAYIAHAPLEPRAALAEWTDDRLTVWTGTQQPFRVRQELARAFRIDEARVRVIVPDTGSGYGGKHSGEAAVEAARLARAAERPVQLVWTREEEFTWAYFRPAGVIEIASVAAKDGRITAWQHHNWNSGASAIRAPYAIPGQVAEFHRSLSSPLRQGSYRALASTANCFARETHLDRIAQALQIDALDLRLKNLEDQRMIAVLQAAAERFGWRRREKRDKRGCGIACGFEKGGYVATCAEVSVEAGEVRVERAVTAFECGAIVNPDNLINQIEGAVIMGLGGALFEAIDFAGGKVLNPRFSSYRVPRFADVPVLETVLVDRPDLPSAGAGETPIVAIAPAIGSAIFAATGVRLTSLPLVPKGLPG